MQFIKQLRILEIGQIWFIGLFAFFTVFLDLNQGSLLYLLSLLLHIASTYFINDYYDWKFDSINPRKEVFKSTPKWFLSLSLVGIIISSTIAFLINIETGLLMLFLNAMGYLYSAPPLRLKAIRPCPALIHAASGAGYFYGMILATQVEVQKEHILYTLFWSLVLASASFFNEVMDRETDLKANIKTLGQHYYKKAHLLVLLTHVIAVCLLFAAIYIDALYVSLFLSVILFAFYFKKMLRKNAFNDLHSYRQIYRYAFSGSTLFVCIESFILKFL